jgi:uncharacterized protein YqjF (DUF2071 family)
MSFLTAEWKNLAIANYIIDQKVLEDFLPAGTELDLWEGKCYVSLVGFMFINTKLLGLKVPFHVNFEEVNLRFYVKRIENGKWKRGVVFIKEIVPKAALTFVANTIYHENYETMPMSHHWSEDIDSTRVEYCWDKKGKANCFKVTSTNLATSIERNSETEFITEHYWGYAKVNQNLTNEYEVTHPRWKVFKIKDYEINVDFGVVYGSTFEFLNSIRPISVMLAEGSEITVENKRVIRVP